MAPAQPILQLDVGQFSDPGRQRQNNEDWLGTFQPEDPERLARKGRLFLLADGMGGHGSGELASRSAVDQVIRSYMDASTTDMVRALRRAFQAANAALYAKSSTREDRRRWGTTLVTAVVRRHELWVANVGDSRAYLLRDGRLRQLSVDHTWAANLDVEPAAEWMGQHLITRALGPKAEVEVDVSEQPVRLRAGDRIILCSDGLTTPLSDAEIRDIAVRHTPQDAASALVAAANHRGGPDNISVIVVQVKGSTDAWDWQTLKKALASLVQPGVWRQAAVNLQRSLAGGEQRWPAWVLILVLLLVALAVIALGFALGSIIFR
jgi:serine/threonine protein phosphatase PrpC